MTDSGRRPHDEKIQKTPLTVAAWRFFFGERERERESVLLWWVKKAANTVVGDGSAMMRVVVRRHSSKHSPCCWVGDGVRRAAERPSTMRRERELSEDITHRSW